MSKMTSSSAAVRNQVQLEQQPYQSNQHHHSQQAAREKRRELTDFSIETIIGTPTTSSPPLRLAEGERIDYFESAERTATSYDIAQRQTKRKSGCCAQSAVAVGAKKIDNQFDRTDCGQTTYMTTMNNPHQIIANKNQQQVKKYRPKNFQCPACKMAFSNNGQLKNHVRIHTGERPFTCQHPQCHKTFTRNEELTRHKLIHTGVRPHQCTSCGKQFGRKDHLKKHVRTHERKKLRGKRMFVTGVPRTNSQTLPNHSPSQMSPTLQQLSPHLLPSHDPLVDHQTGHNTARPTIGLTRSKCPANIGKVSPQQQQLPLLLPSSQPAPRDNSTVASWSPANVAVSSPLATPSFTEVASIAAAAAAAAGSLQNLVSTNPHPNPSPVSMHHQLAQEYWQRWYDDLIGLYRLDGSDYAQGTKTARG